MSWEEASKRAAATVCGAKIVSFKMILSLLMLKNIEGTFDERKRENRRFKIIPLIWKLFQSRFQPVPAWWNGRHNRLKICRSVWSCQFESGRGHHFYTNSHD